jgi:hypothetical protein
MVHQTRSILVISSGLLLFSIIAVILELVPIRSVLEQCKRSDQKDFFDMITASALIRLAFYMMLSSYTLVIAIKDWSMEEPSAVLIRSCLCSIVLAAIAMVVSVIVSFISITKVAENDGECYIRFMHIFTQDIVIEVVSITLTIIGTGIIIQQVVSIITQPAEMREISMATEIQQLL